MSPRGTSNGNASGSSYDRRRRKQWLLVTFGDGTTAPCHYCEKALTFVTLTVDRILAGVLGGTYRRDNIRPACMRCNSLEGSKLRDELKAARQAAEISG